VKGTFTPKLSNMLGTHEKRPDSESGLFSIPLLEPESGLGEAQAAAQDSARPCGSTAPATLRRSKA